MSQCIVQERQGTRPGEGGRLPVQDDWFAIAAHKDRGGLEVVFGEHLAGVARGHGPDGGGGLGHTADSSFGHLVRYLVQLLAGGNLLSGTGQTAKCS